MSESYYLFSNGIFYRKDNVLRLKNSKGEYKDLKIKTTRDIFLFGEITLNTKCLNYLAKLKIPVHIFNYYGYYSGTFFPKKNLISGELLINQILYQIDCEKRLNIAIEFLNGSTHNILKILKYYNSKNKNLHSEIEAIKILQRKLNLSKSISSLMGIEGNIRKIYYSCWKKIFIVNTNFEKRIKNPPKDMINSLISYLNSITYAVILTETFKSYLNPTISYLHTPKNNTYSLTLDISEIFKPLLVDRFIFFLINKKIISESDFNKNENSCYLTRESRKKILKLYDDRLNSTIYYKKINRYVSYRELIKFECQNLINLFNKNENYNSFKMWW